MVARSSAMVSPRASKSSPEKLWNQKPPIEGSPLGLQESRIMPPQSSHGTNRVKFVYNAQFPATTAVVLDYLLRNEQFTPRQGRQLGMDAMMAFYRPMAEDVRGEVSESDRQAIARQCVKHLPSRWMPSAPGIASHLPSTAAQLQQKVCWNCRFAP